MILLLSVPGVDRSRSSASSVLDDIQQIWARLFSSIGEPYIDTRIVLFREMVESACGRSQPAVGSFYCPIDQKIYIDLGFYPSDLAQAYVLAHETGHHVQALLGIEGLEWQADCLAGVWAHSTDIFNRGEIEKVWNEAVARHPAERSTHGFPTQRAAWFRRGFESGQISACGVKEPRSAR